jgi:hypothetical protein
MHDWFVAHYNVLKDFAGPVVALLSLFVTIIIAIFGFSTFGRWKREQLEGRRIDVAFSALDLAYKTRHVFDHVRGALIDDYEWADMPEVAGDTEDKRRRRGAYYAIGRRLEANKEFFEAVWICHAKCMAVFGPSVEDTFLELHKARRDIEIAIRMLIGHLNDAPLQPDPNADLWQQLRGDLCAAEGALAKEGDRVGHHLIAFRDGIEKLCRPIVDREYGKLSNL